MADFLDGATNATPHSPILDILREVQLYNTHGASISTSHSNNVGDDPWDGGYGQNTTVGKTVSSWVDQNRSSDYHKNPSSNDRSYNSRDPCHVDVLLETTPQLRFSSPTDKHLYQNHHRFFPFFLPTSDPQHTSIREAQRRDAANREAASQLASVLWVLAHEMAIEDYGKLETQVFARVFALIHVTASTTSYSASIAASSTSNGNASSNNSHHSAVHLPPTNTATSTPTTTTPTESIIAGLTALDALLLVPSANAERKNIQLANTLSNALRKSRWSSRKQGTQQQQEDMYAVRLCAHTMGRLAAHTTTTSGAVEFVEAEITTALEWLRMKEARSDRR